MKTKERMSRRIGWAGVTSVICLACVIVSGSAMGQAEWENIGPAGGFFVNFVTHPSDSNIIFAGSDDAGGVYKTTNGGTSWRIVTTELKHATGYGLALDPSDTDIIYASDVTGRRPVIKSTDGGEVWFETISGLPAKARIGDIAIDPSSTNRLYLAAGQEDEDNSATGVYKSTNSGASWSQSGLSGTPIWTVEVDENGYIYAGASAGVYRSTNNGSNWSLVFNTASVTAIDVDSGSGSIWVGAGEADNSVWLSTNNGVNWTGKGLPGNMIWKIIAAYDTWLYVPCVGIGFQKSTNGGTSWTTCNNGITNKWTLGIGQAADDDLFIGNFGNEGIYRSTNLGGTWIQANSGVNAMMCTDLTIAPSDHYVVYVTAAASYSDSPETLSKRSARGVINPTTRAVTWTYMAGIPGHGTTVAVSPTNKDKIIVGTFFNGWFTSANGGASGVQHKHAGGNCTVLAAAFDPDNANVEFVSEIDFADFSTYLWRTTNGGLTWSTTSPAWFASEMLAEGGSSDWVWAATNDGMFYSSDNGVNWARRGMDYVELNTVAQDAYDGDLLYAGAANGNLYKTTNHGSTWTTLSHPTWPNGAEVKRIITDPGVGNSVYVGVNGAERSDSNGYATSAGGIFVSTNAGSNWIDLETSALYNTMIMGLDFGTYPSGFERVLYAATYDSSAFRVGM